MSKATDRRCRYGSDGGATALNIESRGYITVSVFNRSRDKTEEVIAENPGKETGSFLYG